MVLYDSGENYFVPSTDVDEIDVEFVKDLDSDKNFPEIDKFGEHGVLSFSKMVQDGVIDVDKNDDGVPVALGVYEEKDFETWTKFTSYG